MDMEIRQLFLVSGQSVISKVTEPNEDGFIQMESPCELAVRDAGGGRAQVAFIPYGTCGGVLPPVDQTWVHLSCLLHPPREIPKQIEDLYLSSTSGIQLQAASPLIHS